MSRPGRVDVDATAEATVHNDGSEPVGVRVVVHGDGFDVEAVSLHPGDSHVLTVAPGASVEIHTGDESAAAPAEGDPIFVVRDGGVVVALT